MFSLATTRACAYLASAFVQVIVEPVDIVFYFLIACFVFVVCTLPRAHFRQHRHKSPIILLEVVGSSVLILEVLFVVSKDSSIQGLRLCGRLIRLALFCHHLVVMTCLSEHNIFLNQNIFFAESIVEITVSRSVLQMAFIAGIVVANREEHGPKMLAVLFGLILVSMLSTALTLKWVLVTPAEQMLSKLGEVSSAVLQELEQNHPSGEESSKDDISDALALRSSASNGVADYAVARMAHVLARSMTGSSFGTYNSENLDASNTIVAKTASFDDRVNPEVWYPVSTLGEPLEEHRYLRRNSVLDITAKSMNGNW
jgi:hypothetical protein